MTVWTAGLALAWLALAGAPATAEEPGSSPADLGMQVLIRAKSERYYQDLKSGVESYRYGAYQESAKRLNSALSADPQHIELRIMSERAQSLSVICPNLLYLLESSKGQDVALVRRAIINYIERDTQKATELLKHASSRQPQNQRLSKLLQTAEADFSTELKGAQKARNVKDMKLDRVLDLFRENKYNLAAVECQEVLLLDSQNALAFKRLGSSLYVLGQREGAKKAWLQAIRLNPNDEGNAKLKVLIDSIR